MRRLQPPPARILGPERETRDIGRDSEELEELESGAEGGPAARGPSPCVTGPTKAGSVITENAKEFRTGGLRR
jgi:hypothetical protein